jgi:hypothetical protein
MPIKPPTNPFAIARKRKASLFNSKLNINSIKAKYSFGGRLDLKGLYIQYNSLLLATALE